RSFCSDGDYDHARYLAIEIVQQALRSPARVVMLQLQDLLQLGDEARMNVPGVAEGNWSWQADEAMLRNYEERIADAVSESGRANAPRA
ncbi:Glycoside hydrolase, family 77, partial [gut metagenome]